jgi:DNA-binding SARP family transcriptional activator/Tfp pilus assembly protein PilF
VAETKTVRRMQVRLLGPIDVLVDGESKPVQGMRRRAALTVLALHHGQIVSVERLVEAVWGDSAPPTAGNTLQSHMSYLRGLFGSRAAIVARAPGYLLELGAEGSDVRVAEKLVAQARQAADPAGRAGYLRSALALWRGRPLADVAQLTWFHEPARRLDQLHDEASRGLVEARLALGEHQAVLADLQRLARDHPFDESIHGLLMLALYRNGRQADALAVYHRLREELSRELGIDPGQAVQDLRAGILRQDPGLAAPTVAVAARPVEAAAVATTLVPAQLPLAVASFTGREREIAALDGLLAGAGTVVISAVSGTAGVGKTALAVHWAHRVADRFPDGQLYVNLRGFDPGGSVVAAEDAVRGFVEAFGVPAGRIPNGPEALTALYRSLLAGKRVLVVLDNARDAAQVRPLLPGTAGCLALVTSRYQLSGLVATEGAHPLTLDLLTPAEARDLLAHRLGVERVESEPGAVAAIIERGARLPLALAIAAARAATHPDFPLTTLAAELRETAAALDVLHGGDPATDIRAVFSWSYLALSPAAARLFRLLGLHPGPDISAAAAASLAATPARAVRHLLRELTRAHLLTEHTPGRYSFHDLLRAYAAEQADDGESEQLRHTAVHRILDHYLHTAHTAARLLLAKREQIVLAAPLSGVAPEPLDSPDEALAWFTRERAVLLGVVDLAAATGFGTHTWQLAWALRTFQLRSGNWPEHIGTQRTALEAARRSGDRAGEADALNGLAHMYSRAGRLDEAATHYQQALQVYRDLGDHVRQAHNHTGLAEIAERQGRPADSLKHNELALELFREAGSQLGQANALNGVGWSHAALGNYEQSLEYCTRALEVLQELGDRDGQASTWDSLGYAHRALANYEQAIVCYQHAVELCRDLGDRYWQADSLSGLGDTHHAAGDPEAATHAWRQALDILDELRHPDAERVRAKLAPSQPLARTQP